MLEFASPLFLLLLLPLLFSLLVIYRRGTRKALLYSAAGRVGHRVTWRIVLARALPILFVLGTALTIIALARPRTSLSRSVQHSEGVAIQMVIDTSGSMEALDLDPRELNKTRLDIVKETFATFVESRPHDLIGLVSFAGYATSRVPLTVDHSTLIKSLELVENPAARRNRAGKIVNSDELQTAIGDALAAACDRLQDAGTESRVVVLLSDGESNAGIITPKDAARAAKALGIRVYTIGVGSDKKAPFASVNAFGQKTVEFLPVAFDEKMLQHIANTTGGDYFNVRDPEGLDMALARIDELEKTTIEENVYHRYKEWFPMFLLAGSLLIVLGTSINGSLVRQVV